MNQPVQAQTVFQRLEVLIDVCWVGGAAGAARTLWPEAGNLPLFGRLNWVQAPRLQIVGSEECRFLDRLEPAVRESLLRRLLEPPAGAVLICGDSGQAEALRGLADAFGTPLGTPASRRRPWWSNSATISTSSMRPPCSTANCWKCSGWAS